MIRGLNKENTMKINTNSWHFKVLSERDRTKILIAGGDSLCLYFWRVMFGVLMHVTALALLVAAAVVISFFVYATGYIYYFTIAYGVFDVMSFDQGMLDSSLVFNVLGVFVASVYLIVVNTIEGIRKFKGRARTEKEPTLLGSYIRAKKQRVCPYLEVK